MCVESVIMPEFACIQMFSTSMINTESLMIVANLLLTVVCVSL